MGRLGLAVDGVGTSRTARLQRQLAAVWRAGRSAASQCVRPVLQPAVWTGLRELGLAHSVPAEHRAGRGWTVDSTGNPGDADLPAAGRRRACRAAAGCPGNQAASERDYPVVAGAVVGAGALLYFHGVRLHLCGRRRAGAGLRPQFHPAAGAGRLGARLHHDSAVRASLGHLRPPAGVHPGRGAHGCVWLCVFRNAGNTDSGAGVRCDCDLADPAQHAIRSAGGEAVVFSPAQASPATASHVSS
jgi:hypothetical protein